MTGSTEERFYRKILVGYDGSANAKRALDKAIVLSVRLGSELRIAVVVDTVNFASSPFLERELEQGRTRLEDAISKAREAGLKSASGSFLQGHPADRLLNEAKESRTDLIVVGRRGIRGLKRFLMGSVSSSIVGHSQCDVLVVK